MDWFLYDRDLRHEKNEKLITSLKNNISSSPLFTLTTRSEHQLKIKKDIHDAW